MKKSFRVFSVILLVLVIGYVFIMSLPWIMMAAKYLFLNDSQPPDITNAEFNIEVTYEARDEVITQTGTYVCEYKGVIPTNGIQWRSYVKETNEEGLIIYSEKNTKIICILGSPEYFMGELTFENGVKPHIVKVEKSFLKEKTTVLTEQELLEQFNIRILSWKVDEPVNNIFN